LLPLIITRKKWESCEQLNHNAAKAPHVDLLCIGEQSQHDVRRSVKS